MLFNAASKRLLRSRNSALTCTTVDDWRTEHGEKNGIDEGMRSLGDRKQIVPHPRPIMIATSTTKDNDGCPCHKAEHFKRQRAGPVVHACPSSVAPSRVMPTMERWAETADLNSRRNLGHRVKECESP